MKYYVNGYWQIIVTNMWNLCSSCYKITVTIIACHWALSWATSLQFTSSCPVSLRLVLILSSSLYLKMAVFWVVALCSLVEVYQCFRGLDCMVLQPRRQPSLYSPLWEPQVLQFILDLEVVSFHEVAQFMFCMYFLFPHVFSISSFHPCLSVH
jgi:hypothetical protein